MKVLITGDREWTDIERVIEEFEKLPSDTIIIQGECRGADLICKAVAEQFGFKTRDYPADWKKFKKAAGPIRNRQMLKEEHLLREPIDLCLVFHNDIENSNGTADMLSCVEKTTIEHRLIMSHYVNKTKL